MKTLYGAVPDALTSHLAGKYIVLNRKQRKAGWIGGFRYAIVGGVQEAVALEYYHDKGFMQDGGKRGRNLLEISTHGRATHVFGGLEELRGCRVFEGKEEAEEFYRAKALKA